MSKASVRAPSNIAFIKYWGAEDLARAVPVNPSISMTLAACVSHSTVEALPPGETDQVLVAEEGGALSPAGPGFSRRVTEHLSVLRRECGSRAGFRVATRNSFPSSAGIASSASGFAALTLATTRALGLTLPGKELSRLARLSGSGSASRSVFGGYVEWPQDLADEALAAAPIATATHWPLCDLIALVETGAKEVSSLDGHRRAATSPHFAARLSELPRRLELVRQAIRERDLALLGPVLEEEAVELHLIAMSSRPPIFYWNPATLAVLARVRELRAAGLGAWCTMDAGANVHVITEPRDEAAVAAALGDTPGVTRVIHDRVGDGPELDAPHLF